MPEYRYKQILEWLYKHNISEYSEIKNLPMPLIKNLENDYPLHSAKIINRQISIDGTRKYLVELSDGALIESVGIPSEKQKRNSDEPSRLTVCFSTQVGCPMGCLFCATGMEGFTRNLGAGEIIEQIHLVQNDFNCRATNIVAMGQGEPFLNMQATLDALTILNHKKFDNIGARHITISTCGIPKGIDTLARDSHQYVLAISLHSAIQKSRNTIMPKASKYNLKELRSHIVDYVNKTKRRVTFEYLLINDLNDDDLHLKALIEYCTPIHSHVNLLFLNKTMKCDFDPSNADIALKWQNSLQNHGIETSIRSSRGSDINGACGQLKNSYS